MAALLVTRTVYEKLKLLALFTMRAAQVELGSRLDAAVAAAPVCLILPTEPAETFTANIDSERLRTLKAAAAHRGVTMKRLLASTLDVGVNADYALLYKDLTEGVPCEGNPPCFNSRRCSRCYPARTGYIATLPKPD